MTISESYASTIVEVKAYFGFDGFECEPEEISGALGIAPDRVRRKGETHILKNGHEMVNRRSSWSIESSSDSKDINIHLRELISRLNARKTDFEERFGQPDFSVLWKGNYLYAGSGPFYEADVLAGIASLKAMLWHDIYQVNQDES